MIVAYAVLTAILFFIGVVLGMYIANLDDEGTPIHQEPPIRVWFWRGGGRQKEFHPVAMEISDDEITVATRYGERTYDPDNFDEITVQHRPFS